MSSSSEGDEFFDIDEQASLKASASRLEHDETVFLSPYAIKEDSSNVTTARDNGSDPPLSQHPIIQIDSSVGDSEGGDSERPKSNNAEIAEFMFKEPVHLPIRPRPTSLTDDVKKIPLTDDKKSREVEKRRRKLEDLRKRMLTDDDEGGGSYCGANASPPGSKGSSLDGVYALTSNKHSHPFRIVEHDAVSLQSTISLGRVGRILGSTSSESALRPACSKDNIKSSKESVQNEDKGSKLSLVKPVETPQEEKRVAQMPDLVTSTKRPPLALVFNPGEGKEEVVMPIELRDSPDRQPPDPVAPPRRKKKTKDSPIEANASTKEGALPSPASAAIESLAKDFENALDLKAAVKGAYVVKPQDNDANKAAASEVEQEPSTESSNLVRPSYSALEVPSFADDGGSNRIRLSSTTLDDDGLLRQLNMLVRTRTDSGKPLSDMEILEQVTVLNLDTGERIALSVAEDKLPRCVNPLSLHIMRLTSEYVSNSSLEKEKESDEESMDMKKSRLDVPDEGDTASLRKKTSQLKKFLGSTMKKTVDKAKMIAQEVSHSRHKDKEDVIDMPEDSTGGDQHLKMKASHSHKGPYEFDTLQLVQEITGEHSGPIWCMKFSQCGRLLATAGQDRLLRIWVLRAAFPYFQDMRTKYNADTKVSPTPSQESLVSQHSSEDPNLAGYGSEELSALDPRAPFMPKPFCIYAGHTSDLLDVSWSKNYFILSSSMDKTVRLWHISRRECLCCFQHIDFVTAIAFHPRDDRYFLSGSLDGKLRLWNIPDKKVALWNELDGSTKLITAANFCQNGKVAVVGSYDGRCIFYTTEQLKYHTQIHVRSSRGKNAKGRKITGIEPMPGEDKILITSNDSRVRLYDLRDLSLSCKYKGCVNFSSQIKASFSHDGKFIISGSENQCIYIWKTNHDYAKFSSARRDRNDFWEGVKAHNAVVTSAVFAPDPALVFNHIEAEKQRKEEEEQSKVEEKGAGPRTTLGGHGQALRSNSTACSGYVTVSADFNGVVKVFLNRTKPKHSSLPVSALA